MLLALSRARDTAGPHGVVCVTGSLHAAGAALKLLEPKHARTHTSCGHCDDCVWA